MTFSGLATTNFERPAAALSIPAVEPDIKTFLKNSVGLNLFHSPEIAFSVALRYFKALKKVRPIIATKRCPLSSTGSARQESPAWHSYSKGFPLFVLVKARPQSRSQRERNSSE